jgi:hypothetical protein
MRNLLIIFVISFLFNFSANCQDSKAGNIPLPEHPRPDYMRTEWLNLNGYWNFMFDKENVGENQKWFENPTAFTKKILVPFPWGSKLSEVANEADIAWYARKVKIPESWKNKRVFVVVGASDWATSGWFAGKSLGSNRGGYTPFEFELTSDIIWGSEQNLVFKVDDSPLPFKLFGKQGYGDAKGFWQTVYLEARGSNYFDMIHFTPDIDNNKVKVEIALNKPSGKQTEISIKFNTGIVPIFTTKIKKGEQLAQFEIAVPNAHLWDLDDPFLYEIEVSLTNEGIKQDKVSTYFGMRKISVTKLPGSDYPYVALNNKPVYLQLTLDQSYHPDGFYTFPSDEFMRNEILLSKQIGLNGNRIHVKVEVPRKLYWADRLGLLIMADVPNSWGEPDADMRRESESAMRGMIKRDYNHPSVFSWVLFNETWGLLSTKEGKGAYHPETQAWVTEMYKKAKQLDQSRLIEDNSPCGYDHVVTDLNSWHAYLPGYEWGKILDDVVANTYPGSKWNYTGGNTQGNQPMLNSECGNVWGYNGGTGDIDWSWDYHIMMNEFRMHPKMCGWLYTEHHDMINEWNGYYKFDRTRKFTGIEELMPGMTLNDLHNPYYISTGSELCQTALPSAKIDVPVYLSVLSDKLPATNLIIKAELCGWDFLGRFEVYSNYSLNIPYSPWMTKDIGKLSIQMPDKQSVAILRMSLETTSGQVLSRNFTTFKVSEGQSPRRETIEQDGKKNTLLRFAPNSFTAAKWTLKQWNVLDGLKVNGAGSGFFEYKILLPSSLKADELSSARLIAELSSKQLFGKDNAGSGKIEGDFMLGQGTNDPGLNPNSYPMTDEKKFPGKVRIFVNDTCLGSFLLEDDPADHRGILSWNAQKHDKTLNEVGSYGYLVKADIPIAIIKQSEGKELLVRFEVDSVLSSGLAIYGEDFGRYPIDPTICFEFRSATDIDKSKSQDGSVNSRNTVKGKNSPSGLKVNQLHHPLAVDSKQPLFSWKVNSDKRGDYQTAYRVTVSSTKEKAENNDFDIWDSGKIKSSEQSDIIYEGIPLESAKDYYWKVCNWNSRGTQSDWSETNRFATGFLSWQEWKGDFIGGKDLQLFRKEFTTDINKTITGAKLYIGSLGVPVVFVNGEKAGNSVLDSDDRVARETNWYSGYDVSNSIRKGKNAIGVMIGPGQLGSEYKTPDSTRFILNLKIIYADGSADLITTDKSWKATKNGPLVAGEINNATAGEKYDARNIKKGWNESNFDDYNWESGNAISITSNKKTLKARLAPPMKVVETLSPQSITEVYHGTYVVDAGRNITGWAQIKIDGKPGDKIEMRFAEDHSTLWNDYTFSVSGSILSGSAGILFRAATEKNFYYWKLTTAGKIIAFRNVNGEMQVIKEIPCSLSPNTKYKIAVKAIGNKIETYCNNSLIDTIYDSTFSSGKVGFRESECDTATFTDIKVVHEASNKTLLESSGKNPSLWLNGENIRSKNDIASGNQLEITNSDYVISRFGNVNGGIEQTSLSIAGFVPDAMGTGAEQYDYYIHGGYGVETWEPFQTIHGFRYLEVKGISGFDNDNIKIRIAHHAVDEETDNLGSFTCSNPLLNDLYTASTSSIKSALQFGIPAACVSRDERNGWTGDAECTSQAANYYANMEPFYKQWFVSMRETQHSDGYIDNLAPRQGERAGAIEEDIPWSSAAINVTWDTYLASGDKSIIREQYSSMKRFIDWCVTTSNVSASTENYEDYTTNKDCWGDYGSILQKDYCCPVRMPEQSVWATAFFYNSTVRLSVLAEEIGKTDDSQELRNLALKIQSAYNKKFLKEDDKGAYYFDNSQAANAIPLAFGLCPENKKAEVARHLVSSLENADYSLTVGVLGLYAIFDALCDNGCTDVAYKLVSKKTYPSWGNMISQGATSMWEFWDGRGSHNHMFVGGKMNAFLIKNLAGISSLKSGYTEVLIKPGVVGDLTNVKASTFSPKGKIESEWIKTSNNSISVKTLIPVNCTANIYVPLLENKASDVVVSEGNTEIYRKGIKKDTEIIKFIAEKDGCLVFKIASGRYEFDLNKK